jgi:hypothetical protein
MRKEEFEKWANDNNWLRIESEVKSSFVNEIRWDVWLTPAGRKMSVFLEEDNNVRIRENLSDRAYLL